MSTKTTTAVGGFFLVTLAQSSEQFSCTVTTVTATSKKTSRVASTDRLLPVLMAAHARMKPSGMLLCGTAARFSESRVIATVMNTLAYAWHIPVAHIAPERLDANVYAEGMAALASARGPLMPTYSAEPHITAPKVRAHARPTDRV